MVKLHMKTHKKIQEEFKEINTLKYLPGADKTFYSLCSLLFRNAG